ncbi:AfsR/SARP family transcriptional regulator [Actinophytocola sp.]|uniref:AfsR/SARP family transcriptional regulator n=1 Tax=Actinophytocola sp. TaxID=1872138 RepID=UPI002D3DB15E|nr:BTAD domain-containing putative transcriptional regulator [Actinophytocola sp.]HYQ61999.1 BTAD domain-containing putative transcriptional regulator [Actinophytocola sp.]
MAAMITLLGEVTAQVDGRDVDLGPPRQRCVLAALAVEAGRLLPAERLVRAVWGVDTPRRGRATLHSHISRLRKASAGGLAIVYRSDGYTLVLDQPDQVVDLLRFRALCDRARGGGDDTRTVELLTEALALWRGEPLTGLSGEWVEGERDRWQQERWAAEHDLVDAQLRTGQGEELVARLSARTRQQPLDERAAGQYMLALHRAGRPADALDHYRRLRQRLVAELGTDLGAALQALHQRILAADPCLDPASGGAEATSVAVPRQLPGAPAPFVGRRRELDRLEATLATERVSPTLLISAIGGTGGIGKTWLVLHWAHRNLRRFPDGQLFVDLHGFSPTGRPAHPADVLGGFLDALGVDRDHQPAELDRRAESYRSLVADRRMLIVLDNVATTDQVIPLLPGGHHCTVMITSRNQLHGLIARHGARPVHLDVLTDAEAHALLTTALGPDHAHADPRVITELVELCGRFPLALGLIAARGAADPRLPLRDIAADLRALGPDALDSDDPTASLPAVLSWSLRHLTDRQREVFALLSIAPGPDTGLPAAVCLTGLAEREAHAALQALIDASLVERTAGGRYAMHDLVRAYATTTADALPAEVREAALGRVLDHYTHTAYLADQLVHPQHHAVRLDPPAGGAHLPPLPDASAAWAWLDTEHACLLAAQQTAGAHNRYAAVWWLAWSLHTFHYRRGHRHDQLTAWQAAADAAVHLPDPTAHAHSHRLLGLAHARLDHHADALHHLRHALTIAEHHRDPTEQAHAHNELGMVCAQRGDDRQALAHARQALDLYRGLDKPMWEARALNGVGWCAAQLGDYETAREHCQAALTLNRQQHSVDGEAAVLDSLGYIDHHSGRHTQAIDHYTNAVALYRDLGNAFEAADTLETLGQTHRAIGQLTQARTVLREAHRLYREQGRHDDAARTQRELDTLDRDPRT